jgi:uncharacterized membrane protein
MADMKTAAKGAMQMVSKAKSGKADPLKDAKEALSSPKGLAAAGAVVAALPLAIEGVTKLVGGKAGDKASELGDKVKDKAKSGLKESADEMTPDMPKGLSKLFGGGGDDDSDDAGGAGEGSAAPGTGSGRRMPIQQSVDVAVPIRVAYDQWTRFEDWPEFMHRLESAEQIDDCTVAFSTKVWGINRRFEAEILEQAPDRRIEWDVTEGMAHTGVVTFHEISDRLTRIEVTLDVEPHGLIEKAGRGMRFVKRAVRGDLHRFKAYVELNEESEKGWRGRIEDGKVKRRPSNSSRSRGSSSNGSSSKAKSGARS